MNQFAIIYLSLSTILLLIARCLQIYFLYEAHALVKLLGIGGILVTVSLAALMVLLSFLPVSRLHTPISALKHFLHNIYFLIHGYYCYSRCLAKTKQLRASQDQVLFAILYHNANTELGRKLNLARMTSREQFRVALPLSTFDDYRPYVERMKKGEENIMSSDKVVKFCTTSGTTGNVKYIPFPASLGPIFAREAYAPIHYSEIKHLPLLRKLSPLKTLRLFFLSRMTYSECGTPIGMFSSAEKLPPQMLLEIATPEEGLGMMTEPAQSYIHLLFALIDENLARITTIFAGTILVNLELLEREWRQLANDIRHGQIAHNTHGIPKEVLDKIHHLPIFRPNPQRADKIQAECAKGFEGITKRLWPHISEEIFAIPTGSHSIYLDRIREFTGQETSFLTGLCIASEALYGMAFDQQQKVDSIYTLASHMAFFEFIPEEDILSESPQTLFADQLQVGRKYEVVITSRIGFYRYRLQDIIEIVGYLNQAPTFQFCCRSIEAVDLRGEKTTTEMIASALLHSATKWQGCHGVRDYAVTESVTFEKGVYVMHEDSLNFSLHYVFFVEGDGLDRPLTPDEVQVLQDELAIANPRYKAKLDGQSIGSPKVFVVRNGSFLALKQKMLEKNHSVSNQSKMPRYLKTPEFMRFLVGRSYALSELTA